MQIGNFKLRRRSLHHLGAFLAVFALIILASQQALAGNSRLAKTDAYIDIPVLYLTDRAEEGDGYSGRRKYVVNCQHVMNYGTAIVSVPKKDLDTDAKANNKLGWTANNVKTRTFVQLEKINSSNDAENKKAFFDRLAKMIAQSGGNRICIFVHGAADAFDDAMQDTAMLAYQMQCPTILYSWPSIGKLKDYHIDEGNCEWTQLHFNMFWKDMEAFAAANPVKISLVAHSVGNRILARAVSVLQETQLVSDAELVSPDIDAEVFQHDMQHFKYSGVPVRLYSSEHDKVLSYTQMLYGGYYRLGENAGPSMMVLPDEPQVATLPKDGQAKRIDFTILDKKWVGHHFPFTLVGSMSRTGSPPQGYMLVKAHEGKGNMYTRYDAWHNDLKVPAVDDTSRCWKVVKQKESPETHKVSGTGM